MSTLIIPWMAQLLAVLLAAYGLSKWKWLNQSYKWLVGFLVAAAFVEIISEVTRRIGPNFYMLYVDTLLQGVTLTGFFVSLLKSERLARWLWALFAVLVSLLAVEAFLIHGLDSFRSFGNNLPFNSISRSFFAFVVTFLTVWQLLKIKRNPLYKDVELTPLYWIFTSFIGFFGINIAVFFFGYELANKPVESFTFLYSYYIITFIVARIILFIALWRLPRSFHI